jgi:hypothetical protein
MAHPVVTPTGGTVRGQKGRNSRKPESTKKRCTPVIRYYQSRAPSGPRNVRLACETRKMRRGTTLKAAQARNSSSVQEICAPLSSGSRRALRLGARRSVSAVATLAADVPAFHYPSRSAS